MRPFEYLSVILAIVLGLGIAHRTVSLHLDFALKCVFFALGLFGFVSRGARAQLAIALASMVLLLLYIAALFRQLPA